MAWLRGDFQRSVLLLPSGNKGNTWNCTGFVFIVSIFIVSSLQQTFIWWYIILHEHISSWEQIYHLVWAYIILKTDISSCMSIYHPENRYIILYEHISSREQIYHLAWAYIIPKTDISSWLSNLSFASSPRPLLKKHLPCMCCYRRSQRSSGQTTMVKGQVN